MTIIEQIHRLKSQGFDFSQPLEATVCLMGETLDGEGYSLCDSYVPALPFKFYDIMVQPMEPDEDGTRDPIAEIDNIETDEELEKATALIESYFPNALWETI